MGRGARWGFAVVLGALLASAPAVARAQGLSADESARLGRGETVAHPQTLEQDGRSYVGGIAYSIVEATPEELGALLENVPAYTQILPHTKEAKLVGRDADDRLVELRQGTFLFEASYTIRVRELPSHREVRFWVDRSRPHGIEDAWGFFRYEPLAPVTSGGANVPRVLLTYGILVDIGPGIVRDLFEGKIQRVVLSVPDRVRAYVLHTVLPRRARVPRPGVDRADPPPPARFP